MTDRVIVGTIGGAFGVHGDVRLKSYCADPAAIADYTPLYTEGGAIFTQVVLTGQTKNGFTAKLNGVTSKEQADALRNVALYADRATMPALPDDEFYYADLIGLDVLDTGGVKLGIVHNVMDNGAGDLLEVAVVGKSETVLIPFTRTAVPTIDLSQGRVIADPPDGIFE